MTPGEASAKGAVLIIEHPDGWRSVAPHVFDLPGGGIVFIDDGWTDPLNASHAAHVLEASFSPFSLGWGATDAEGRDIFIEEHADKPAQEGTRDVAKRDIERSLGIRINLD
jgi:hypothetical protein